LSNVISPRSSKSFESSTLSVGFDYRTIGGKVLIPITLRDKQGKIEYEEHLLWNPHHVLITPEEFIKSVGKEENLTPIMQQRILQSLKNQVMQYSRRLEVMPAVAAADKANGLLVLEIDVTIGQQRLRDQVLWDHYDIHSSPEEFANKFAQDLGLIGTWAVRIAHSIREQILQHFAALSRGEMSPMRRMLIRSVEDVYKAQSDILRIPSFITTNLS
jgi:hypothetical protein